MLEHGAGGADRAVTVGIRFEHSHDRDLWSDDALDRLDVVTNCVEIDLDPGWSIGRGNPQQIE